MKGRRLVEVENIMYILEELFNISLHASSESKTRLNRLENYIKENILKENILKENKVAINEFKRIIYQNMQNETDPEKKQKLYQEYQELKNNFG